MSTPEPWYRAFFERDYYDTFYAPLQAAGQRLGPEATAREVDFIVDALELPHGARVLDLACGHGRHSVALASRGFDVTGLDLSAYHIELARAAAAEAGVSATFLCDDMRNLPVAPPFDAVINFFTAFGYLESDEEDASVISRVAEALSPGGRFLIETNNALRTLRHFQPGLVTRLQDGGLMIEEGSFDAVTGRIDRRLTYVAPDATRREGEIHVRAYTAPELAAMFRAAGLSLLAAFGDIDRSPLTFDSRRMILVAGKPAG